MKNVKLLLSQKSQFDLAEKIQNKNKKRTRASLFQSSEDGKQEIFLCGLMRGALSNTYFVNVELKVSTELSTGQRISYFKDIYNNIK